MIKISPIILFISLALTQSCVSDNPEIQRIIQSLPTFMLQMGTTTVPPGGSTGHADYCYALAIDPTDEGIYCAGLTKSDLAEPNGDPGHNFGDAYIVKFDRFQNLLWARQFGADTFPGTNAFDESFVDLAFDSQGNVYAGGGSNGQAVIAKFSRKGQVIWRRYIPQSTACSDMTIWRDRIFCVGMNSTYQFSQVYEVDQNGTVLWLTQTTGGTDYAYDIVNDSSGNLYVVGSTEASFNPSHVPAIGKGDAFVWKLSSSGNEIWIDQFGTDPYEEYATSIALDRNGNLIIGGTFKGSALAPPDNDFDPLFTNITDYNSFVASFRDTGSGLALNWNTRSHHTDYVTVESVVVTSQNEIITGGITKGALLEAAGSGLKDTFLTKLSSSGEYLAGRQFGAVTTGRFTNAATESCLRVAVDPLGNIYCGGHTNGSNNETNAGAEDIMIWRLKSDLSF